MSMRNTFFIVLFATLIGHSVIAQGTTEPTAAPLIVAVTETRIVPGTGPSVTQPPTTEPPTTEPLPPPPPPPICGGRDEIPFFSTTQCISRSAYTGIFITSIVLAGLSFLMLIGLLILCCIRRSGYDSDSSDDESSITNSMDKKKPVDTIPLKVRDGHRPRVLQNVTGATPLEPTAPRRPHQSSSNKNHTSTNPQPPSSRSNAPYTEEKPVSKPPSSKKQPSTHPTVPVGNSKPPSSSRPQHPPSSSKPPRPKPPETDTSSQF